MQMKMGGQKKARKTNKFANSFCRHEKQFFAAFCVRFQLPFLSNRSITFMFEKC